MLRLGCVIDSRRLALPPAPCADAGESEAKQRQSCGLRHRRLRNFPLGVRPERTGGDVAVNVIAVVRHEVLNFKHRVLCERGAHCVWASDRAAANARAQRHDEPGQQPTIAQTLCPAASDRYVRVCRRFMGSYFIFRPLPPLARPPGARRRWFPPQEWDLEAISLPFAAAWIVSHRGDCRLSSSRRVLAPRRGISPIPKQARSPTWRRNVPSAVLR